MASEMPGATARFAILIDAENASPKVLLGLLSEVAKFGVASVKRAYGDWTTPQLAGWKAMLLEHAVQPMQQFENTKGKNSTDSAMIIDAMDLLHLRGLDGFCIVSSDSDFTGLARRIRENGLWVVGFGERKTPKAFIVACDRFVHTDLLDGTIEGTPGKTIPTPKEDRRLVALVRKAVDDASDDTGWAHLGAVGSTIAKQQPDFDPRTWNFTKLSDLVRALPMFQVEVRTVGSGASKAVFIRDARKGG